MEAAGDLLVKQNVLHRVGDMRVKADGELADVARAFIGVKDLVELLAVALTGGFDDLAILEDEADVLEALAVVDGGRVVLQQQGITPMPLMWTLSVLCMRAASGSHAAAIFA